MFSNINFVRNTNPIRLEISNELQNNRNFNKQFKLP